MFSISSSPHPLPAKPRQVLNNDGPGHAVRFAAMEALEGRRLFAGGDLVVAWNAHALQALTIQPPRVPLSRNLAIVHIAMFDAVNAIDRGHEPYFAKVHASHGASKAAAAAQAAHDTLVALYPSRESVFDEELAEDLAGIPAGRARQGVAIGKEVARQILELRANDGSSANVSYTPPNTDPGQWQPTDINPTTGQPIPAASAHVPGMTPFAVDSVAQFRPGPPPELTSVAYAFAFNEAKTLGRATGSTRTDDQTLVAGLWQTALGNHQVWNRIAQDMTVTHDLDLADTARLFALMNISLSDGLQTSFGAKFHYELWRPKTAIQRADEDGNPATVADPNWTTLHATTPPYPTYSGNAATIGAACATVLASFFGDDTPFEFDWSRQGSPSGNRSYDNFWDAANEQADSRIYGGIHFRFDSVAGQEIGADVAGFVLENFLVPQDGAGAASASAAARITSTVYQQQHLSGVDGLSWSADRNSTSSEDDDELLNIVR